MRPCASLLILPQCTPGGILCCVYETQEGPYTKYEAGETRAYYERAISILQSSKGLALWASRVDRCSRTPCAGPLATSSVAHH